ncbi:rhomboid family intramembrane serine protease [Mucilaginibacter calamicampi]|uniref:Rhomboid family intramembrane serine protease n=1 Tax=Mucilaginibacter calamicampi TaxID=1302352 RepID=A0ABW2YYG3_9SPHI
MQSPFANIPPVVKNLLIINIICFLPYWLFNPALVNTIYNLGSAHYFGSPLFKKWQPITYMFLHGDEWHIIFNMFALYSFGNIIEYNMGSKRFIMFYFICGIGGLLGQWLVQAIEFYHYTGAFITTDSLAVQSLEALQKATDINKSSMVGASGAIFGVLVAFGMLYPNAELMIMFIPVPVKAKYIIPVYIIIELTLGVGQFNGDNVAHFAHLGGAVLGFILIKLWRLQGPGNYGY